MADQQHLPVAERTIPDSLPTCGYHRPIGHRLRNLCRRRGSTTPDRIGNANSSRHDRNHWFNNNAFACPGRTGYNSLFPVNGATPCDVGTGTLPIGRYGTESVGDLHGPGTVSLSSGLSKVFVITEGVRLRAEGTFTNVLNHTNLADPQLDITQANFGQITQARGSDFDGNRTGQLSLRLEF